MATWKKVLRTGNVLADDLASSGNSNQVLVQAANGAGSSIDWRQYYIPFFMQWSCRLYTGADPNDSGDARRKWYYPSSTYGPSYYNWNSYYNNANPRTAWYDYYNPGIVVPRTMTLEGWSMRGNLGSAGMPLDLMGELKTNTNNMTWDHSSQTISLTTLGSRQTGTWSSNNYGKIGETGLAINMSEGDVIYPFFARDTELDVTTVRYGEFVFILNFLMKPEFT